MDELETRVEGTKMTKMKKLGQAALAAVLAFSLTLPTPALAWAASGSGLAAGQLAPGSQAEPDGMQAFDASADVWDGSVDTSWYNPAKTEFTLTKPAQVAGLAALVNAWDDASNPARANPSFRGVTVKLGSDIWLNATTASGLDKTGAQRSWTPIADLELTDTTESVDGGTMPKYNDTKCFDGTFDGQGHVIKNLYIYNDVEGTYGGVQAFIANVGGHATIENLGIDGGYVYGRVAAGLVAISHVVPEAVSANANVAVTEEARTFSFPHIIGCFNSADVKGNGSTTRGLAGIFAGEEQYRPYNANGNGGRPQEENYHGAAYIANCYNLGNISQIATSSNSAGGIAGTGCVQMYGCYNFGMVESDSRYAASLAGVLVGSSVNVGQNHADGFAGCSAVADSYAVDGSIWEDDQSNVKLFNLIDATHGKGQTGKWNPAVTGEDGTYGYNASVAFKASSWFAGADSWKALSQSYVPGTGHPELYWQSGQGQWDINALDADGYRVYGIKPIERQQYTGSPLKPTIAMEYEVEASDGSWGTIGLHQGSDFTVSYSNNVEIGTSAQASVQGIGRFYNGRSVPFEIVGGSLADTTIEPIGAQWWYGAGTVEPEVVVTASNGDTLKEGTDYTLEITGVPASASGFDTAGKATATAKVTPTADSTAFTGEKSITFTVLQASERLSGDGTQANPWKLSTKGDLQFLAHQTSTQAGSENYGASGKFFLVTDDIDATAHCDEGDDDYLTDRPVDPLFSYYAFGQGDVRYGGFGGTISGAYVDGEGNTANHEITMGQTQKALQIDDFERLTALFVYTRYGASPTFENLTICGSSYAPDGAAAGLLIMAQPGTITVKDCVNKARVQGDQSFMGAAAGFIVETSQSQMTELVMENCVNEGAIVSATKAAGFVANLGGAKMTFTSCKNTGAVTAGSGGGAGGFVAYLNGTDSANEAFGNVAFNGCANTGDITVKSSGDAGGLVAWNQNKVKGISFNRCSNTGTVTYRGPGNAGAGIMGRAYSPAKFTNCYNNALIKNNGADIEPAGILGYAAAAETDSEHYAQYRDEGTAISAQGERYSFLLENVYSAGGFGDHAAEAGGLVGNLWLHQRLEFENAYYESGEGAASKAVAYDFAAEWPSAVDPPETAGDAVQMDADAMKEVTFASMLGNSFVADEANGEGELANGGFPVLLPLSMSAEIKDLSSGSIGSGSPKELSYQGSGIELSGLVVLDQNGETLAEGRDYVVFYSADGTQGTAIVQGIGLYTGTLTHTYTIKPCDLSRCRISSVKGMNYTNVIGLGASQDVTLTNPAGKPMTEGVDFEILYANNMAPGTAYLMAHAKGPYYTGAIMRPFTIAKGDLSQVQVRGLQAHYPATGASGGLYIYERLTAANGQDLQRTDYYSADAAGKHDYVRVFYSYNESTGKYDLPVWTNDDKSQGWATHVTKAGRYKVELRADGYDTVRKDSWTNGYWYGETSATFSYGNRIESDNDVLVTGVEAYYGQKLDTEGNAVDISSGIVPRLVNKDTGYSLEEGSDYTLSFKYLDSTGAWVAKDTVDYVGEYKIEIAGKNTWFGTREVLFSVASMYDYLGDKTDVAGISSTYYYTGNAIKPAPTSVRQTAGGLVETLRRGTDYELSYVDASGQAQAAPTEPGTYYAVISGLGDYKGSKRVMFTIEKPVMKVYVRTGSGAAKLKKQYTKEQFTALKSATAAINPVSALYCDTGGTNWSVASTNNYVTLAGLLSNAGVYWRSGVSMTYASGSFKGRTYTYDQVNKLMFYPNTSATAIETWMGRKAPFVLSISDQSLRIGSQYTNTAADAEAFNLENLDGGNMPRAIMGVLPSDYVNASKSASSMMGSRLVKGVDSITVTLPKSANTVKVAAKSATQKTTYGKAKKLSAASVLKVSGAVGSVSYSRASGDSRIGVASNGTVSVPATLPAGRYRVSVKVTAAGNATYAAGSATASFTVVVGKAATALSVKAKSPSVSRKSVKKKAQKISAATALAVSGARGKLTYAKVAKGSNAKLAVAKDGTITVPKGMKKGAYKVNVKVTASGDANHAAASRTVTVTVHVKK